MKPIYVRVENVRWWFVNRLPKRLIYWAAMRLWVHGTTGRYGDTESHSLTVSEAIRRWEG